MLATAESCTGEMLASLLAGVEGASHALDCGIVTSTAAAKTERLGMSEDLFQAKGSVSMEVAVAKADGALERSDADMAASTTGFAGPAGPGDEVGVVWLACASGGGETRHKAKHFGDIRRDPIRAGCMETALLMIREAMP